MTESWTESPPHTLVELSRDCLGKASCLLWNTQYLNGSTFAAPIGHSNTSQTPPLPMLSIKGATKVIVTDHSWNAILTPGLSVLCNCSHCLTVTLPQKYKKVHYKSLLTSKWHIINVLLNAIRGATPIWHRDTWTQRTTRCTKWFIKHIRWRSSCF